MVNTGSTLGNDAVLSPYLRAGDEPGASVALEKLICDQAQPLIEEIIRGKLRVGSRTGSDITEDDASDLLSEVTLKLVQRLRTLRSDSAGKSISNLRGYIAMMAYNTCDGFLRKKYPRRYSLKNQIRYVLTHRNGLAIWENADGVWLCGFEEWRASGRSTNSSSARRLSENPARLETPKGPVEKLSPPDLLAAIFDSADGPVDLDTLVSVVGQIWQVKDSPMSDSTSIDADTIELNPIQTESPRNLDVKMDQRRHLEKLWAEVCELPIRQRIALLMSLRDAKGCSVLALFPLIGIASIRHIAETLDMPSEKLAALWNELPLEDGALAESLGVTRQQVINLRKCARERLWRRTKEFR
jgi:hypothetical protein